MTADPFWDDVFHGCAWAALVELARECQGWPDSRAVKERANELYEAALAETGSATDGE